MKIKVYVTITIGELQHLENLKLAFQIGNKLVFPETVSIGDLCYSSCNDYYYNLLLATI